MSQSYYTPRGKSISLLLERLSDKKFNKATLGGCIIEKISTSYKISKENNKIV